jgi:hypothetical protein
MDQGQAFLTRLAGFCKYALKYYSGKINLSRLAAGTNQRVETVFLGLRWLAANGQIEIIERQSNEIHFKIGEGVTPSSVKSFDEDLQALLRESAAYRKYFLREDKDRLINSAMSQLQPD